MAELTQARNTPERMGNIFGFPVKGGVVLYQGGIAAIDADGFAVPASPAADLVAVGRIERTVDNSAGTDGAVYVEAKSGIFGLANDLTNPVTQAHVGREVRLLDDQTVTSAATGDAKGICVAVEKDYVWTQVGL